jgi:predicted DNA-binding transcriptional regulator AlpA
MLAAVTGRRDQNFHANCRYHAPMPGRESSMMKNDNPGSAKPLLLNDKAAAQMLGIGKSTLWRKARAGRVPPPVTLAGTTRWRVADLERFVATLSAAGSPSDCQSPFKG